MGKAGNTYAHEPLRYRLPRRGSGSFNNDRCQRYGTRLFFSCGTNFVSETLKLIDGATAHGSEVWSGRNRPVKLKEELNHRPERSDSLISWTRCQRYCTRFFLLRKPSGTP
jgi:hypothetical protein